MEERGLEGLVLHRGEHEAWGGVSAWVVGTQDAAFAICGMPLTGFMCVDRKSLWRHTRTPPMP